MSQIMDDFEPDIPIYSDAHEALESGGPFRMNIWHYGSIKLNEIPRDKWSVFQNMLFNSKDVIWQIHHKNDIQFILPVLREHKNLNEAHLDFYYIPDNTDMEELAQAVQLSRPRKLSLRKDHDLEYNEKLDLSPFLRAAQHIATLEKLHFTFDPSSAECEALACALQNPHLQSFHGLFDEPACNYWPLITPVIINSTSITDLVFYWFELEDEDGDMDDEDSDEESAKQPKKPDNNVPSPVPEGYRYLNDILRKSMSLQKLLIMTSEIPLIGMKYIVNGLKESTTLKELDVSLGEEEDFHILFEAMAHDQIKISSLTLSVSSLPEYSMQIFSNSMRTNTTLTSIHFYAHVDACQTLGEALKHNSTLQSIRIRCKNTAADINGFKPFCDSLKLSTCHLTKLNLSDSQMTSQHFELIADMLLHNTSLRSLVLHTVLLDDDGLKNICGSLIKNTTLQELNVDTIRSKYGLEGLKAAGTMLKNNNTLTALNITCDFNWDENLDVICDGLKHNTRLRHINLGGIFDDDVKQFENKISALLEHNYALTSIEPTNGRTSKVSSLLRKNKRLKSEHQFKVVILSHNISRSHEALEMLPRELWVKILCCVTHPGTDSRDAIIKKIFDSYMLLSKI